MTARAILFRLSLGATIVAAAPAAVAAQASSTDAVSSADSTVGAAVRTVEMPSLSKSAVPAVGPRVESTIAGVRLQVADAPLAPAPVASPRTTRGQALAIVGGAAFLGGIIIGDSAGTVIAVGGLGVGVYGLWLWLGGK